MSEHELTSLFGRLHPALVHLPIGFLVLLALLELLSAGSRFKHLAGSSRAILVLSLLISLVTAASGWFLAGEGGYDLKILFWHRWLGVALPALILLTLLLHRFGKVRLYRAALAATFLGIAVVGHLGGTLTHGSNFLSPRRSNPNAARAATDSLSAYHAIAQPFFDHYCVSCHGPEKSKAHLRLDTFEFAMKGSGTNRVIEPCNAAQSEVIQRLSLPLEHDDHMPPDGKPQPSDDEIALLRWWIDSGATPDKTVQELKPSEEMIRLFNERLAAVNRDAN